MKIIAVDSLASSEAVQEVLQGVRQKRPPGWQLVEYQSPAELIARLRDRNENAIVQLEIVSEGSPVHLDGVSHQPETDYTTATAFGKALKTVPGMTAASRVYLSGCNTGCADFGIPASKCIAQKFANAARCRTFGAVGYIDGLHATNSERCRPQFCDSFGCLQPMPGSVDHEVRKALCWREFIPA